MEPITHFFVYGSLRPDDTTGMPWTQPFLEGISTVRKAKIHGARMCKACGYAGVILDRSWLDGHVDAQLDAAQVSAGILSSQEVVGYILGCSPEIFSQKLAEADAIEEYPDVYDRAVVVAYPLGGEGVTSEGVRCYVYHRNNLEPDQIEYEIPEGDWVKFNATKGQ
mmetsp:Transcript_40302/g.77050  ORF Transcript_40302/g.77050 Transcript_40302/m.77050 type:complete len:166 (-) Transcript_40302:142-639(-)